jgi:hypothetical protein
MQLCFKDDPLRDEPALLDGAVRLVQYACAYLAMTRCVIRYRFRLTETEDTP